MDIINLVSDHKAAEAQTANARRLVAEAQQALEAEQARLDARNADLREAHRNEMLAFRRLPGTGWGDGGLPEDLMRRIAWVSIQTDASISTSISMVCNAWRLASPMTFSIWKHRVSEIMDGYAHFGIRVVNLATGVEKVCPTNEHRSLVNMALSDVGGVVAWIAHRADTITWQNIDDGASTCYNNYTSRMRIRNCIEDTNMKVFPSNLHGYAFVRIGGMKAYIVTPGSDGTGEYTRFKNGDQLHIPRESVMAFVNEYFVYFDSKLKKLHALNVDTHVDQTLDAPDPFYAAFPYTCSSAGSDSRRRSAHVKLCSSGAIVNLDLDTGAITTTPLEQSQPRVCCVAKRPDDMRYAFITGVFRRETQRVVVRRNNATLLSLPLPEQVYVKTIAFSTDCNTLYVVNSARIGYSQIVSIRLT